MGHAIFTTLQDILIRYHRMNGKAALWLPGTDHAGLATQQKIDQLMIEQGLDPSSDEFYSFAENYKNNLDHTITNQLKKTGASCDWSRYTFTLDDSYSKAVIHALAECHKNHMLYYSEGQWYLDMSQLANNLIQHIKSGNIKIIPENETKTLLHFLENIEPWCISRQIKWGHRLPIWTNGTDIQISETPIDGYIQEEGCLDTWFSSSLWPFASLGWPEQTADYKKFYPAQLIETADDILFFWCARMLMMGDFLTGQLPFNTIYLHGIMRDKDGLKMSKSLGNGIDPLDIISEYGCDAMRFALAENSTPGQDMRMWDDKIQSGKSIGTKLWNASKFCLSHYNKFEPTNNSTNPDDINFIDELKIFKSKMGMYLEKYEFHLAGQAFRHFLFDEFCGKYLELSKDRLYNDQDPEALFTLMLGLKEILKIGHPFMPFITEYIWQTFNQTMLISEQWY